MSTLERLSKLVSPAGGLISRLGRLDSHAGDPEITIHYAQVGDLANVFDHVRFNRQADTSGEMDGTGCNLDPEAASISAIAEGLERYASSTFSAEQFIWATAHELGSEALDLDSWPCCSESELAHPACPVKAPDKGAPIRWIRGVSLMTTKPVWIPAMAVCHYLPSVSIGERFCYPVSTGCAAHITYEQALVSGICEVIERDAIAVVWLHQLPIPRIDLDVVPESVEPYVHRYQRSFVTPYLFDATTDLGVPTVYGVHVSPNNPRVATVVSCATDLNPVRAVSKALREAVPVRVPLHRPRELPESVDQFHSVFHGAVYMANPERRHAFDFLLSSPARRALSQMPDLETGDAAQNLRYLLALLRAKGMEAFAVDLTTDEAERVGMCVVRVIIPQLQPLSFSPRAQYLGHPRVYEAPGLMGHVARSEEELNRYPQPFA